ncbi:MAG: hypothetical protein AAGC67_21045 [Myxococcota bacterium]
MLDLPRLRRLRLTERPLPQRILGRALHVNYVHLPGVELEIEGDENLPDAPVIFAMNHTDRYNYWPWQYLIWKRWGRFTAAWVKGKYYENRLLALFMESMLQLPTVSRGYLITKDFQSVLQRTPTDQEYMLLRDVVDRRAVGEEAALPEPPEVPERLLRMPRSPLGFDFDPTDRDYADYICDLFQAMMARFVELNEEARDRGVDLLIFPQGTRSIRLLESHIGIAQIALHLRIPIVPVGCNGSDSLYPGPSPFARKGRVVYRIGQPIHFDDLAAFHVDEAYAPFSAAAERDHAKPFRGVADLVTDRIEQLLDEPYRRAPREAAVEEGPRSSDRFV